MNVFRCRSAGNRRDYDIIMLRKPTGSNAVIRIDNDIEYHYENNSNKKKKRLI